MAKWYWEDQAATIGKVCTVGHQEKQASKCPSKFIFNSVFLFGFTLGEVISAAKEEIVKAYYPGYFMQSVMGQIQTKQVRSEHDDSYQGKRESDECTFTRSSFVCHVIWG